MEAVEVLIKMAWWYGRGLPPRRLGTVIYEWGGFSAAPPGGARSLPASVAEAATDILAYTDSNKNVLTAAWLWSKPPPALWRLLPTPMPKRRILYVGEWNKMYISDGGAFAVKWISTDCCVALLWSYPWAWIVSRHTFRIPVPAVPARGRL